MRVRPPYSGCWFKHLCCSTIPVNIIKTSERYQREEWQYKGISINYVATLDKFQPQCVCVVLVFRFFGAVTSDSTYTS